MLLVGTTAVVLVAIFAALRSNPSKARAWVAVFAFGLTVPAFALVAPSAGAAAVASVPLATAGGYSVLGATTVTNTGASVLASSLGVSPGSAVTGFPPGLVMPPATIDVANAVADQAQSDLTIAYVDAAGRSITATTPADLGGLELTTGVYAGPDASPLGLTGTLTLDAEGDPDSVFIFQTDSTLITASSSTVELINGAQACNVFWQVGSSATLGTGSMLAGTVLAQASVTVNSNVTVHGRTLARTGAVTLDDDVFTSADCAPGETTTTAGPGSTTTTVSTVPGETTTVAPTSSAPSTTTSSTIPDVTTTVGPGSSTPPSTTVAPTTSAASTTTTSTGGPGETTTTAGAGSSTTIASSMPGGPTTTVDATTTAPLVSTTLAESTVPGESEIPSTSVDQRSTTTMATQNGSSGPSGSPGPGTSPGSGTNSTGHSAQLAQTGWPTVPLLAMAGILIAGGVTALLSARRAHSPGA